MPTDAQILSEKSEEISQPVSQEMLIYILQTKFYKVYFIYSVSKF